MLNSSLKCGASRRKWIPAAKRTIRREAVQHQHRKLSSSQASQHDELQDIKSAARTVNPQECEMIRKRTR